MGSTRSVTSMAWNFTSRKRGYIVFFGGRPAAA
jgi:hypothetical protein